MKIEELNIPLKDKGTKKIRYEYHLEDNSWYKNEYDEHGNYRYYENSNGFWYKF